MADTHEYKTLKKYTSEVTRAVQSDLTTLSGQLFSKNLISEENASRLRNERQSQYSRAAELVSLVLSKVELNPGNYKVFISVLNDSGSHFNDLIKLLEHDQNQVPHVVVKQLVQSQQDTRSTGATVAHPKSSGTQTNPIMTVQHHGVRGVECSCSICASQYGRQNHLPANIKFPYLELDSAYELDEIGKQDLIIRLERETTRIMLQFDQVVSNLYETITVDKKLPIERLKFHLRAIKAFPRRSSETSIFEEYEDKIKAATKINEIFDIIDHFISFIDYQLLNHLVGILGSDEDKESMKQYCEKFGEYAKRRIIQCPAIEEGNNTKWSKSYIKLDSRFKDENFMTINQLQELRFKVGEILNIPVSAIRFCCIQKGCIRVNWQIPCFVEQVIFPLCSEQLKMLKELGVIQLCCGNYEYEIQEEESLHATQFARTGTSKFNSESQDKLPTHGDCHLWRYIAVSLLLLSLSVVCYMYWPSIVYIFNLPRSKSLPYISEKLVGREKEMKEIMKLLDFKNRDTRIVNIVGTPGIGKSTLALHVGFEMVRNGVVVQYINIAEFSDEPVKKQLSKKILDKSDTVIHKQVTFERLMRWARERFWNTLLIMDNCDAVVKNQEKEFYDAVMKVANQSLNVKLLTTSRQVPPTTYQWYTAHVYRVNEVSTAAAHELLDYYTMALKNVRLSQEEKEKIVHLVGNMPLALKLVGSMLSQSRHTPSAADIIRQLDIPEGIFTFQQLYAAINISYQNLSMEFQYGTRQLTVFPGSFTLSAAHAVLSYNDIERYSVAKLIECLVKRSLLERSQYHDTHRYHYHRLIRKFLTNRGNEAKRLTSALNIYYSQQLRRASFRFKNDPGRCLTFLDTEHHNIEHLLHNMKNMQIGAELTIEFEEAMFALTYSINCGLLKLRFSRISLCGVVKHFVTHLDQVLLMKHHIRKRALHSYLLLISELAICENTTFQILSVYEDHRAIVESKKSMIGTQEYMDFYIQLSKYYDELGLDGDVAECHRLIIQKIGSFLTTCEPNQCNYYDIGVGYNAMKKHNEAVKFFEKYLETANDTMGKVAGLIRLIYTYTDLDDYNKLKSTSARLHELHSEIMIVISESPHLLISGDAIQMHIIDLYKGAGFFEEAYQLEAKLIDVLSNMTLKITYHHLDKKRKADDLLQMALSVINHFYEAENYTQVIKLGTSLLNSLNNLNTSHNFSLLFGHQYNYSSEVISDTSKLNHSSHMEEYYDGSLQVGNYSNETNETETLQPSNHSNDYLSDENAPFQASNDRQSNRSLNDENINPLHTSDEMLSPLNHTHVVNTNVDASNDSNLGDDNSISFIFPSSCSDNFFQRSMNLSLVVGKAIFYGASYSSGMDQMELSLMTILEQPHVYTSYHKDIACWYLIPRLIYINACYNLGRTAMKTMGFGFHVFISPFPLILVEEDNNQPTTEYDRSLAGALTVMNPLMAQLQVTQTVSDLKLKFHQALALFEELRNTAHILLCVLVVWAKFLSYYLFYLYTLQPDKFSESRKILPDLVDTAFHFYVFGQFIFLLISTRSLLVARTATNQMRDPRNKYAYNKLYVKLIDCGFI